MQMEDSHQPTNLRSDRPLAAVTHAVLLGILVAMSVFAQSAAAPKQIPQRILYWEMFKHVNFLEQQADIVTQQGKDGTSLRNFYQTHAQLSASETTLLKQTASSTAASVQAIDQQIHAIVVQYRAQNAGTTPSNPAAFLSPSGTGISLVLDPNHSNDSVLSVNYWIAANALTGKQHVWVTTYAGVDNDNGTTDNNAVGIWDPPTQIQSISVGSFPAGQTTNFTISGTGFGTGPTVSVSGPGVTASGSSAPSPPYTSISAWVTIDPNSSGGTATVTVTAGDVGQSFQEKQGQSNQDSKGVAITSFSPPVPQITFNGTNVSNNGAPSCPGAVACVFVGQKILLTAVVPNLPPGVSVKSYSWSSPQGTVVGGYSASAASGATGPFPVSKSGSCQTLAESCLMFYWVDQASSRTVTLSYTLISGGGNSATVTFNVDGPTSASVSAPRGSPKTGQS